ncbi:protease modulator HflC [candidate division KSB1 bacterium]
MSKKMFIIIGAFVLLILINSVLFTVDEKEQAIILQFGKPLRVIQEPGLNVKIPFIQVIEYFEDRLLEYDSAPTEIITEDKKTLVVDNYACWKITEPLKFMQAVHDENGAQSRLDDIVYSELRVELGRFNLHDVVSSMRDTIMEGVTVRCNLKAQEYGISIVDVRIKRADLPEENEKAVFERMRAERIRQANQYRSEGEEEALKIRAQTDKEKVIILAEAYKKAEADRGDGDSQALKIYADTYQKDPQFYRLIRTLEAYKKTLSNETTVIFSSDSEFMRLLENLR